VLRKSTIPFSSLAGVLWWQGRLAEAENVYREATSLPGSPDEAQANLGYILLAQERNEEALAALREAERMDPRDRRVRRTIADLEEALALARGGSD